MPNCTNCGTWNPEDKTICWRCQTELPRPEPPKKKRQNFLGFPHVDVGAVDPLFCRHHL